MASAAHEASVARVPEPVPGFLPGDSQDFLIDAAAALHANGEEAGESLRACAGLANTLGLSSSVLLGWTELIFAFKDSNASRTTTVQVTGAVPASVAMNRVVGTTDVIEALRAGQLDLAEAKRRLAQAAAQPPAHLLLFALACAGGASALALIFGAQHGQAVALIAVSGAAGAVVRRSLANVGIGTVAQTFAAALLAGLIGALAMAWQMSSDLRLVAVCACMILVPGPHLLNGALDLVALRIPLGLARLAFAGLVLLAICAGLVIGLAIGGSDLPAFGPGRSVPLWVDVPAAGVAVACYSIFFSMPIRSLGWPVAVGMIAHAARWWAMSALHLSAAAGAGIACLIVAAVMVPVARRLHLPFAGVGFACVVSLIPGVFIFRMAGGFVALQHQPELLGAVVTDAMTALLILLSMTFGLVLPKRLYDGVRDIRRGRT